MRKQVAFIALAVLFFAQFSGFVAAGEKKSEDILKREIEFKHEGSRIDALEKVAAQLGLELSISEEVRADMTEELSGKVSVVFGGGSAEDLIQFLLAGTKMYHSVEDGKLVIGGNNYYFKINSVQTFW